jgi:hypothetical protein
MQVARTLETGIVFIQFRSEFLKEESDHLEDLIESGRIILKRIISCSNKLVPVHPVKAYGEVIYFIPALDGGDD